MSRTTTSPHVSDQTLDALGSELVRLGRRRDTSSSATTLDVSAYKILWLVVEHGPHTLRGLAEGLLLDQSTINRQVHAVIERGLAERFEEPGTSGLLVRATPEGEAAYRADTDVRREGLRAIATAMGEQATAELTRGLARFNDVIDEKAGGSSRPTG